MKVDSCEIMVSNYNGVCVASSISALAKSESVYWNFPRNESTVERGQYRAWNSLQRYFHRSAWCVRYS